MKRICKNHKYIPKNTREERNAYFHYVKGVKNGKCDIQKYQEGHPETGGWNGHCGVCQRGKTVKEQSEREYNNYVQTNR